MHSVKIEICGVSNELISNVESIENENSTFEIKSKDISKNIRECIERNKIVITEEFLSVIDKKSDDRWIINSTEEIGKKGKKRMSLRSEYKGKSYFGNVVGVIEDTINMNFSGEKNCHIEGVNEEMTQINLEVRLQIRSRFDLEKPYFLATLLLRNKIKLNDNLVLSNEEDLYDYLLLFWFKSKLQEAFEKGFYKAYRRFNVNEEKLRGSIDISRHIKLNGGQNNGRLTFSYRENTVNNFLNHLIVVAYEHLKKKYPDLVEQNFENDVDIKSIIVEIKNVTGDSLIESRASIKENNQPISHPYFIEYEEMRVICLKILRDEGTSIWDTEVEKTKSILFYIPDLWELFLEDSLREHEEIHKDLYVQGKVPKKDSIRVFGKIDAQKNNEFVRKIYPDFLFFDGEIPYFILDAKFKKGWESSLLIEKKDDEKDKGNSQLYDLSDYDKCIRDMNSIYSHATGIIFPTNKSANEGNDYFDDSTLCHKISEYNQQDIFYTFPVVVPPISVPSERDSDVMVNIKYTDWRKNFNNSIKIAIREIQKKIKSEKDYSKRLREFIQENPFPKRE